MIETKPGDSYLLYILDKYKTDILACFPLKDIMPEEKDRVYVVNCGDTLAGITFGKINGIVFDISLDYATPSYRDCSVGRFLSEQLAASGIRELRYIGPAENHKTYLKKLNYTEENGIYVKRF